MSPRARLNASDQSLCNNQLPLGLPPVTNLVLNRRLVLCQTVVALMIILTKIAHEPCKATH